MSFEEYKRLSVKGMSIWDALAVPGYEDIELDIPPRRIEPERPLDLED